MASFSVENQHNSSDAVDMKGMDTCRPHGKKIRFYCNDHSKLCCTTCAVLHGKCDRLDEIATVSERQVPAPSFLQKILQQSEADADSEIMDCKQSETGLDKYIANISEELQEMRDCFMKLFDIAENKIMQEANAIKSKEVKLIQERHAASSKVKTEIKEVLSICSTLLEHGTKEEKYIFWRNIVEKNQTFQSDITDQRKKKVATTMAVCFPKELLSMLEKGNNFIKLICERNITGI
ncbi:hypothetical protein DPMN_022493 [Dreissena polymorpha]|uniref:B box-type domain-containing protein n=1 Tax=Dreissena polymorpha TaxID=45954 RepID=A0A9D4NPG6_DREPO|nr:hypothetical protein DPMN_022493 [Dreissena polymorpha]